MNRILKRFNREHRKTNGHEPRSKPSQWVFHEAQWGDLKVLVMPRSVKGEVFDSNTGIVLEAPYHRNIKACVVVNDGRMPTADKAAVNNIMSGDPRKEWKGDVWTIPTYRVTEADINDAWKDAVKDIARTLGHDRAEAQMEQICGWCTDSLPCAVCHVTIPGHFQTHVMEQARQFGWGLNSAGRAVCPAHSIARPLWSDEEIAELEKKHGERPISPDIPPDAGSPT